MSPTILIHGIRIFSEELNDNQRDLLSLLVIGAGLESILHANGVDGAKDVGTRFVLYIIQVQQEKVVYFKALR